MRRVLQVLLSVVVVCLCFCGLTWAQADFIRGDANCDQIVDGQDAVVIQLYLFVGGSLGCQDAADVDDDGAVTPVDLTTLQSYLNTGLPQPRPPFPACGQDPTADALTCASCCPVSGGCDTLCQTAPSFQPSGDTAITGGHYTFCDFLIAQGVDVSVSGACTLDVAGTFLIDSGASLRAHCTPLVINHLADSGALLIYGEVTDTCASASDSGGTFILRSRGSMVLGAEGASTPASIAAADIFIGDPDYEPRPQPDTVNYVLTGESVMTNLPPLANMRATFLPPQTIEIEIIQLSLTSLPMQGILYFGNGDSIANPPLIQQYSYDAAGTYRVSYLLTDSQGNSVRPSLVVNIPSGDILQGYVMPFVNSSLVSEVGETVTFGGQAPSGCGSVVWDFDGELVPGPFAQHNYPKPGIYMPALIPDVSEFATVAGDGPAPLYIQQQGSKEAVYDPPAPVLPFPSCNEPPLWAASAPDTHSTTCAPCSLCTVPVTSLGFPPGSSLLVMGDLTLKSTRIGGWLVTGYSDATIIIRPGFTMTGAKGKPGGIGQAGQPGGGFAQVTLSGQIIDCGGTYSVGAGGDGGLEAAGGCPATTKGGRGGDAGGVAYLAPFGSVSWCGNLTFTGADGGDGGASGSFGGAAGACMDGCGAFAHGGNGGLGGGGFVALASSICLDSAYSVTFGGTCTGGDGGYAEAVASDGGNCAICAFKAGDGGHAGAYGGKGGSSFFYFAMFPPPSPAEIAGHLFPTGTWNGGNGEDADATAGFGGNALVDCCDPPLPGIDGGGGGYADAHGGRRGKGATTSGVHGNGVAICGDGGNGKAGWPPGAAGAGSRAHDDIVPGIPCSTAPCPPGLPGAWCPLPGIPWNPRWDLPNGYKFGQNDTTISGSLYEGSTLLDNYPIRLMGESSYGTVSGNVGTVPVYSEEEGIMRCSPGAMVFDLGALPNGGTADGFYAVLSNRSSQSNSLHLLGYSGGSLVSHQIGSALCAETTLQIPTTLSKSAGTPAATLDSVVLWGLDFTFEGDVGLGANASTPGCPIVLTGDVNVSGTITSADIIGLVNYVFKGGAAPLPCVASGDVNCSGTVTSADIIHLVNFVFKGGVAPCDGCTSPLASGC